MSIHENRRRASSFGEDAEQYDRARPSYPAALADDLLAEGARRVLDVGCGTGIAGRLFAERGCDVLGVEPDARMAEVARSHGLQVEIGSFEEWDAGGRVFDLLVSGQAWHWVDPEVGPAKAADVLRSGGRFAAFWNLLEHDESMSEGFDRVYGQLGLDMSTSVALGTYRRDGGEPTIAHLAACGLFAPAESRRYFWEQHYSRDEWLDQLPTHSDHRTLAPDKLAAVLSAVGELIDAAGGSLVAHYDTMVVTATRLR